MYAKSLQAVARKSNTQRLDNSNTFIVGDAAPCALEKAEGHYRWQVVVRAASTASITKAWRWISSARPAPKGLRITLDVDALNLI